VTVSISRMSGGAGYRYVMSSVAAGDGDRRATNSLTRYYAESGTPPGRWLGSGIAGLDGGRGIRAGSPVTEEQLFRLLGTASDPVTGRPLGRAPQRAGASLAERIHARLQALSPGLNRHDRERLVAEVGEEEKARATAGPGKAVAGFDLTFAVPKSVSALWAVADGALQAEIVKAHHDAIADALAYAERNVFCTRIGANGVAQVPVRGVLAAAFDHWDTRTNDPHLHTHVVVANRVQALDDSRWRTLDSRALFRATVALSELHQGLLMDRLSRVLGVGWEPRARRHSKVPRYAIAGVPEELCAEFARRGEAIEAGKDRLVRAYRGAHGREPSAAIVLKLRQQATLTDRPDKEVHSLAELTQQWRERARRFVGSDTAAWAREKIVAPQTRLVSSADVGHRLVQQIAESVLAAVQDKRATFTRWNVYAESARQLQPIGFATTEDRLRVTDRITDSALGLAVLLAAPELSHTPERFQRPDDSSVFRRAGEAPYTTAAILEAERRLLAAARDTTGPVAAPTSDVVLVLGRSRTLGPEQAAVVQQVASSGRAVDVLVGAAGTGKTAALAGLVAAWQDAHGPDSVIGLAPSATAAQVLGEQIGIATENTAKWLTEADRESERLARIDQLRALLHRVSGGAVNQVLAAIDAAVAEVETWRIQRGQLLIVDEASLAGTLVLDRIASRARAVGVKVLLVGDWAQMSAVQAGGAFAMLVRDREPAPELTHIRRFSHRWERAATMQLRAGDPSVIDRYQVHDRLRAGDRDTVIDAAYGAWIRDTHVGQTSLLIAADHDAVTELNARARADLVSSGMVADRGVPLFDGTTAGVGDRVVTRCNDRALVTGRSWVKNGDRWTVTASPGDGSLILRRYRGSSTVLLPADYVSQHVDLGYATTTHRAQGMTVDSAHAVVTGPTISRETLYVAMTRGRHSNHLYVATDYHCDPETQHGPGERQAARDVLTAILSNAGADLSAHETIRAGQEAAVSWPQLVAEYDTIAAAGDHDHWTRLLDGELPSWATGKVAASEAFGPLVVALRRADALGVDLAAVIPRLVAERELDTAEDVAAVLRERVERWLASCDAIPRRQGFIAGLHPKARHVVDPDLRRALDERAELLDRRAATLAEQALAGRADWVGRLGAAPSDPGRRAMYLRCLATVAAYRDQWSIASPDPLGPASDRLSQHAEDRALARRAAIAARRIASLRNELSAPAGITWSMQQEGPSL
jgi:conjugative relaxase-like TrwC/TraI family protein